MRVQPAIATAAAVRIRHAVRPRTATTAAALLAARDWLSLRVCESGNNYREDTGNGYYGAYQFNLSSWRVAGGSGMPNVAPPAAQDAAARRLLAIQGWRAWPECATVLGR